MSNAAAYVERFRSLLPDDAFSRGDESDDGAFYATDRFVPHLDARALATVERIIATLVVERAPRVLDLMAGPDSHLPAGLEPAQVVGLGLNVRELEHNPALDDWVLHDLNRDSRLPFADERFDVVLNTVSVDYLTRPFDVFAEVSRVLVPGGLHLVIFSNRFFPSKVVKLWRESSELERQMLVEDYFRSVEDFGRVTAFVSRGQPRPADDKYAASGLPSDPVWALYAEKRGAPAERPARPAIAPEPDPGPPPAVVAERKRALHETLRCPYCDQPLQRWEIAHTHFTEWDVESVWVCFNNQCPYLISGWGEMTRQGNHGFTYRLMYVPERDACHPTPIAGLKAAQEVEVTPRG